MNRVKALYSVLAKNTEMKLPKKGGKARIYMSLGIIAVSCIMIPCCLIVGFISYIMTTALIEVGAPVSGLLAELHIMSAFSLVFGMLVIFNILFFSSDREHLVPLPFKSWEILLAKFLYAYMAESVMEFMILIAMFVGFFIAYGVTVAGIISAVIGVILVPLIPLVYCAVIGLILLVLLRNVKSGKVFGYISSLSLWIFVGLFLYSFRGMGGITVENYMNSLAAGNNVFTNVLNKVFFTVPLLTGALEKGSFIYLILFVLANLLVLAVMVVIGSFTYQDALYTIGSLGSGKKKHAVDGKGKILTPFWSYAKKEILVLLRTRAYSGNCIFINLFWPILIGGLLWWNRNKDGIIKLKDMALEGNDRMILILSIAVIMLTFIASAMNSLASTAFTREGMHLDLIKYIPVSYKEQLKVKAFICFVITYPCMLITAGVLVIFFGINPLYMLYYALTIALSLLFTTYTGLYLDSAHPHSTWDDEYSALRGNLNTFFDMALVMVVSIFICALGFLLFEFGGASLLISMIFLCAMTAILGIASLLILPKKIIENMEEMIV